MIASKPKPYTRNPKTLLPRTQGFVLSLADGTYRFFRFQGLRVQGLGYTPCIAGYRNGSKPPGKP